MDNPEKLATQVTQDKDKNKNKNKNKPKTMCVGHHCLQENTNNVNKTWALLQTIGGKDEHNINAYNSNISFVNFQYVFV